MNKNPVKSLRHFSRVRFDAAVQLHMHGKVLTVQLIDIAIKGALVQVPTTQAFLLEETCRLVLSLAEGSAEIVMAGRIVHIEDRQIGIECLDIDVPSLTQLRRLVELNTGDGDLMTRELSQLFAKH